jgi:hypothetical protein
LASDSTSQAFNITAAQGSNWFDVIAGHYQLLTGASFASGTGLGDFRQC